MIVYRVGFWEWCWNGLIKTLRSTRLPRRGELVTIGMVSIVATPVLFIFSPLGLLGMPVSLLITLYGFYQEEIYEAEYLASERKQE